MVEINHQKIEGNWADGYALDFHTLRSTPIGPNESGHMQFVTERPPIAELLYRLKYKSDQDAVAEIVETAAAFLTNVKESIDLLIPVPPSSFRKIQPVIVLAHGIGDAIYVPVLECVITTRATTQLKGVTDPAKRRELVNGLYTVDPSITREKDVLLFDDLYRSGTTLNAITDLLLKQGEAKRVRVLTITKTRSNR